MLAAPLRLAGAGLLILLSLQQSLAATPTEPFDRSGIANLVARDWDAADLTEALNLLAARSPRSPVATTVPIPRPPPRGAGPSAGQRPFMPTFQSDYPYQGTGGMSTMPVAGALQRRDSRPEAFFRR